MINSTEIRPVLQDLSFINKLNEKSEHKATVKKKKKKKKKRISALKKQKKLRLLLKTYLHKMVV